jgi:UDP-N-acetylenolpyruvoylglucosamine reductase
MNAGAFGFEIWSLVESVTTINTLGEVFKRSVTEFDVAYRKVVPQHKGEYFIGANAVFNEFCGKIIGWIFKDTAAIRLTNRLRIVTLF